MRTIFFIFSIILCLGGCNRPMNSNYVVKKDSINKKFNVKFYINGKLKYNFFKKFQLTKTKGGSLETKIAGARASVKKKCLKRSKCGKSKTTDSKNSQLTKIKDGSVRKKIAPILKKTNNKKKKKK